MRPWQPFRAVLPRAAFRRAILRVVSQLWVECKPTRTAADGPKDSWNWTARKRVALRHVPYLPSCGAHEVPPMNAAIKSGLTNESS
jgi:hypothetical protein